jgi:hypothetical protein
VSLGTKKKGKSNVNLYAKTNFQKRKSTRSRFGLGSSLGLFFRTLRIVTTIIPVRKNSKGDEKKIFFFPLVEEAKGTTTSALPLQNTAASEKRERAPIFLASNRVMYSHRVTHTDASYLLGTSQVRSANSINRRSAWV